MQNMFGLTSQPRSMTGGLTALPQRPVTDEQWLGQCLGGVVPLLLIVGGDPSQHILHALARVEQLLAYLQGRRPIGLGCEMKHGDLSKCSSLGMAKCL